MEGSVRWSVRLLSTTLVSLALLLPITRVPIFAVGSTERVSVASDGTQGNTTSRRASISADGRYVAFGSLATTLVPGDINSSNDIFVRDRVTRTTERVSVASDGTQANADSFPCRASCISADGRYVVFVSFATNLVPGDTNGLNDIFVRDRVAQTTERVSVASDGAQANGISRMLTMSTDGHYVVFFSVATNLAVVC